MPKFGSHSEAMLATADPQLVRLFREVIKHWDCKVTDGARTQEQQDYFLAVGASTTRNSKHVVSTTHPKSRALDVAAYPIDYADYKRQLAFAGFVLGVASQMGIKIRWGGDWNSNRDLSDQSFNDLVHFELGK
jgi:hypothetical protein